MKAVKHIIVVIAALFVILGIPTLSSVDVSALLSGNPDAVTHASTELPDQPSGEFIVLINNDTQGDYIEEWREFFTEGDFGVIMSDIGCMTFEGDTTAIQLAERYQARLPENQMTLKSENALLLASKAECGLFDAIVASKEMADAYKLDDICARDSVTCITVKGEQTS